MGSHSVTCHPAEVTFPPKGPKNHVLGGGPDPPWKGAILGERALPCGTAFRQNTLTICCCCCRLWYENPGVFTASQLGELRQASLARVVCDNSDSIRLVPRDVFLLMPSLPEGLVSCDDIPTVDLKVWAQCCQGACYV